jgi:hypothetical protein
MHRLIGNADITFTRELPLCFDHQPDLEALRSAPVPWRLATGRDSAGRPYCRPPTYWVRN